MTGDQDDMLARLKAVLPSRWFPDRSPVLDGLITGLAWAGQWLYGQVAFARAQTRIATATGVWLDIIAWDFFGRRLVRRSGQSDDALRRRISLELLRERGTRAAVISVLQDLTGRIPAVFEPAWTSDTGGYSSMQGAGGGLGYGVAGGWGSLALPFQCFVVAYRPQSGGIANVAGWGTNAGGYGLGSAEYATLSMIQGQVTDSDIYAAVRDVLPVTGIAWMQISN
jgi:hypothetical protein